MEKETHGVDPRNTKVKGGQLSKNQQRRLHWFCTWNNFLDLGDVETVFKCIEEWTVSRGAQFFGQVEVASTGQNHIQGVWSFPKPGVRMTVIVKEFPGIHLEAVQNICASRQYCTKEDTRVHGPFIFGAALVDRKAELSAKYARAEELHVHPHDIPELVKSGLCLFTGNTASDDWRLWRKAAKDGRPYKFFVWDDKTDVRFLDAIESGVLQDTTFPKPTTWYKGRLYTRQRLLERLVARVKNGSR